MKILIVGASGATGRLLTEELLNRGQLVKVIVRSPDKLPTAVKNHDNLTVIQASVLDLSDAEIAWKKNGCGVYCFRDLTMMSEAKNRVHPNQKPIPLMQWCIEKSNLKGIILDPYLGSGTTAVACERLNRKWIGIEIEEKYCEIAAKRIENERKQRKLW